MLDSSVIEDYFGCSPHGIIKQFVVSKLASAWFRQEEMKEELITLREGFTKGALDSSLPGSQMPADQGNVSAVSATCVLPDQITLVASSNYDVTNFAESIVSTLIYRR